MCYNANMENGPVISAKQPIIAFFLVFAAAFSIFSGSSAAARDEQNGPDYQQGLGLLEVFKTDSPDMIPRLDPVLKVPWMHELVCKPPNTGTNIWLIRDGYKDAFLVPECAHELGARPGDKYSYPYVAQITFYYEAKESGKYTFTIWHGHNAFTLTVGDSLMANLSWEESNTRGVCELKKGFQRVILWLVSDMSGAESKNDPYFEVQVILPNTLAAVPVTREMMFVKPSALPRPWGNPGRHSKEKDQ